MKLTVHTIHALNDFLPLFSPDYLEKAVGVDSVTQYYSSALTFTLKVI